MNKLPPFLALTLLCGTAAAEPEILTSTVVGDRIEMTLAGARAFRPDEFALRDATTPRGAAVVASSVQSFEQAGGAVAIAIVYQGAEVWIGNDDIIPEEDPGRYLGALRGIRGAVAEVANHHLPRGSEGALITYGDGAQLRQPLMNIATFVPELVGSQKDYYNRLGTDLVSGVDLAFAQLAKSNAAVKALIVIGDGNDTNNALAKAQLADLKKRAARERIQTFAVIYKAMLSDPGNVVSALAPNARTVNSLDGMAAAVGADIDQLTDRTFVTFESPWTDGANHAAIASLGAYDLEAEYLTAPYHAPSRFRWLGGYWQQLLAGFALVGVFALGLRLGHRSPKDL